MTDNNEFLERLLAGLPVLENNSTAWTGEDEFRLVWNNIFRTYKAFVSADIASTNYFDAVTRKRLYRRKIFTLLRRAREKPLVTSTSGSNLVAAKKTVAPIPIHDMGSNLQPHYSEELGNKKEKQKKNRKIKNQNNRQDVSQHLQSKTRGSDSDSRQHRARRNAQRNIMRDQKRSLCYVDDDFRDIIYQSGVAKKKKPGVGSIFSLADQLSDKIEEVSAQDSPVSDFISKCLSNAIDNSSYNSRTVVKNIIEEMNASMTDTMRSLLETARGILESKGGKSVLYIAFSYSVAKACHNYSQGRFALSQLLPIFLLGLLLTTVDEGFRDVVLYIKGMFTPIQAQSGLMYLEDITQVLLALTLGVSAASTLKKGSLAPLTRYISEFNFASMGLEKFVAFIATVAQRGYDLLSEKFNLPSYTFVTTSMPQADEWMSKTNEFLSNVNKEGLQLNVSTYTKAKAFMAEYAELTSAIPVLSTRNTIHTLCRNGVKSLEVIITQMEKAGIGGKVFRRRPMSVYLMSPPGCGKSLAVKSLAIELNMRVSEGEELQLWYSNPQSQIYYRMIETEYWEGYLSQKCVIYDEAQQWKEVAGGGRSEAFEVIRLINEAAYILNMAASELKGWIHNQATTVWFNSNMATFDFQTVHSNEAVTRRLDFVWVVIPSPGYEKCGFPKYKKEWGFRLDTSKIKDNGFHPEAFSFYDTKTHMVYDYDTAMMLLVEKYWKIYFEGDRTQDAIAFAHIRGAEARGLDPLMERVPRRTVEEMIAEKMVNYHHSPIQVPSIEINEERKGYFEPKDSSHNYFKEMLAKARELTSKTKTCTPKLDILDKVTQEKDLYHVHNDVEVQGLFSFVNDAVEHYIGRKVISHVSKQFNTGISSTNQKDEVQDYSDIRMDYIDDEVTLEPMCWLDLDLAWRRGDSVYMARLVDHFQIEKLPWVKSVNHNIEFQYPEFECLTDEERNFVARHYQLSLTSLGKHVDFDFFNQLYFLCNGRFLSSRSSFKMKVTVLGRSLRSWLIETFKSYDFGFIIKAFGLLLAARGVAMYTVKMVLSFIWTPDQLEIQGPVSAPQIVEGPQTDVSQKQREEFLLSLKRHNVYRIEINGSQIGFAIAINNKQVLVPRHFLIEFRRCSQESYAIIPLSGGPHLKGIVTELYSNIILEERNKDLCLVQWDFLPRAKNITKNFVSQMDHHKILRPNENLILAASSSKGMDCSNVTGRACFNQTMNYLGETRTFDNIILYKLQTYVGDCGLPVVGLLAGKPVIIGVHIAYNKVMSQAIATVVDADVFLEYADVQSRVYNNYVGRSDFSVIQPTSTKIRKSPLHGTWRPAKKAPSVLRPIVNSDGVKLYPIDRVVDTMLINNNLWYDTESEKVCAVMLGQAVSDVRFVEIAKEYAPLTYEQACSGVDGNPLYQSMERKTSAGAYAYRLGRTDKSKIPEFGESGDFTFDSKESIILRQVVRNLKDQVGEGPIEPEFIVYLKDELLSREKVAIARTRGFYCGSLPFLVLTTQYFKPILAAYQGTRIGNGICIGINPYGVEWDLLARHLNQFGTDKRNMFDVDVSSMDMNAMLTLITPLMYTLINVVYEKEEDRRICRNLWQSALKVILIVGDKRYAMHGHNISGWVLTTLVNCLIVHYVWTRMYLVHYDFDPKEISQMKQKMYIAAYGDDAAAALREDLLNELLSTAIYDAYKACGFEATCGDKSGPPKPQTLQELSFLKRGFRYEDAIGRYVGPLSMDTILEMPFWSKKTDYQGITRSNLERALTELSLHPQEVWDEWAPKMLESADKHLGWRPSVVQRDRLMYAASQFIPEWRH